MLAMGHKGFMGQGGATGCRSPGPNRLGGAAGNAAGATAPDNAIKRKFHPVPADPVPPWV
jgi:hypothetical protein